jgi:hypothetical protein
MNDCSGRGRKEGGQKRELGSKKAKLPSGMYRKKRKIAASI